MLELCKLLLKKLRLWPLSITSTTSNLCHISNLIIEAILLIGTFKYAFQHLDDINEATEPAFAGFAFATSMFIYIWMISKKKSINFAIEQLETEVNGSKTTLFYFIFHFEHFLIHLV